MIVVYSVFLKPEIKTMTLYDRDEIEIEYQYKEFDLYDIDGHYITTDACSIDIEDESEILDSFGIVLGTTKYEKIN